MQIFFEKFAMRAYRRQHHVLLKKNAILGSLACNLGISIRIDTINRHRKNSKSATPISNDAHKECATIYCAEDHFEPKLFKWKTYRALWHYRPTSGRGNAFCDNLWLRIEFRLKSYSFIVYRSFYRRPIYRSSHLGLCLSLFKLGREEVR